MGMGFGRDARTEEMRHGGRGVEGTEEFGEGGGGLLLAIKRVFI